jgi:hypothetical protein
VASDLDAANPDEMRAGKAAIEKAMSMNAGSDRERGFITALNTITIRRTVRAQLQLGQSCHGPVGPRDRVVAYEKAMRQLRDKYPDDFEVQTFYAFAVLGVGYATPNDTTLSKQLEAAGILEKLWKQNANHPGVVHYLIHSYDYPQFAQRGLTAAQTYNSIAPWVPHALHMPSHIFTRLGMWDESIAANRASAEASRAYAAMRHRDAAEAEELHALDYMAYSYLQEAQDAEAKKIVDIAAKVKKTNPELEFSAAYALAAIPTRYAFERNDWQRRQTCRFRMCHTGLRSRSWKLSSNMVTRWDARIPATSKAREKRSHECRNYAMRRKSQSSIISKVISTYRCKQLRHGWLQLKARRTTRSTCCDGRGFRRHTRQASRFAGAFVPIREQLGTLLLEMGNQRRLSGNLRLRSRSIRPIQRFVWSGASR